MSIIDTGLPDGTEDFIGIKAKELENLRNILLNKFYKSDYQLVFPSLIEFSDSLGGNANDSLKASTYSFSDETSDKDIAVRPDISQQIARIDLQRGSKAREKYCYFGETLRKSKDSLTKSRIAYKAGVELFGKVSSSDEIEIIKLMISSLKSTGKYKTVLSVGRTEPFSAIVESLKLPTLDLQLLKNIMSSKSSSDLEDFCFSRKISRKNLIELKNLTLLNGKIESLRYLRNHKNKIFKDAARKLEKLLKKLPSSIDYHVDFSDFPGFDYHSGLVFSLHAEGFGFPIAKGGFYRTTQNDLEREAIGFDINISSLIKLKKLE